MIQTFNLFFIPFMKFHFHEDLIILAYLYHLIVSRFKNPVSTLYPSGSLYCSFNFTMEFVNENKEEDSQLFSQGLLASPSSSCCSIKDIMKPAPKRVSPPSFKSAVPNNKKQRMFMSSSNTNQVTLTQIGFVKKLTDIVVGDDEKQQEPPR